ncbi:hypothetical protein CJI49_03085, partial [Bifidobacteriaceae bacterium NR016]
MQSYTLKEQREYVKLIDSLPSLNKQLSMLAYCEVKHNQSGYHAHINKSVTPVNLSALDKLDELESLER